LIIIKISDIKGVDRFKIKHEVYRDGNNYYKSDETPEQRPGNNSWEYNYTWANLGSLPSGNHEIRVFRLPDIEDGNLAVLHEIYNALEEISWHQYTNKWDHHIDYYINDGSEFLKKPKPE
jgi:hypothetical protein